MLVRERPTTRRSTVSRRERLAQWTVAVSTVVFAALGAWLFWGPADGVLQVFGWEWNVGDAHTGWGVILMMVAAVLATIYVALVTTRKPR